MKKRFSIIILVLMTFLLSTFPVQYIQAATGSITPTASSRSINVGNSVTVTVRVSSASEIGSWQFNLNYDSGKLRLNSGSTSVAGFFTFSGQKSASYTYSFTAIAAGTASVSISGAKIVGMDEQFMSVSGGSTTISIGTGTSTPTTPKPTAKPQPTINASTNNDLASLKVDGVELTPVFSKGVLEYSVELEPGTEKVNITATPEDGKAAVTGAGEVAVVEGANKLEVKVRAENGDEKTYVINAMVKEFDPIEVSIGKDKYTVIRKKGIVQAPKNYVETTALVNDIEVPAYKSEITGFTLVGLKSETGAVGLYVYDETNETFRLYRELSFNGINFYPYLPEGNVKIPKGYESFMLTIGENEIEAYRMNRTSKHSLLYGMNVDTGKTGFYLYDSEEGTLQRYNGDESLYYQDILNKYLIAVIVLGTVVTALSATSGIMIYKYRKLKKISN
jgi:hypothetical protein